MINQSHYARQFPEAISALKRNIHILRALDSQTAAAAVVAKMIDILDDIVSNNIRRALNELWGCSYVIQRIIYNSMSERFNKSSDRAIGAEHLAKDKDYEKAYKQYVRANNEISVGTDLSVLFMEPKDESV